MSNAVFPTLPGLTWDIKRSPEFKTTIVTGADGGETRIGNWVYPLWHWKLTYEFLRDDATNELKSLLGFFLARSGRLDDFLFLAPDDCEVTDQVIGVGDGTTAAFQCARGLGGYAEPVTVLREKPVIYLDGVRCPTGWSADLATGRVTFAPVPARSTVITADLSYYWRVRFDLDMAEFNQFAEKLWDLQECTLVSVR